MREIVQRVHEGRGHRPARVLLVRPGTIPKTSRGKIQRSRLGRDDRARRARASLLHASGAARRLAAPCGPAREDRLPPADVRSRRHARRRAHLRAAHGGARLRLALGERPRGDPRTGSTRNTPTAPPASSRSPPTCRSSSRWSPCPWWRGSPSACSSAPASWCCPTGNPVMAAKMCATLDHLARRAGSCSGSAWAGCARRSSCWAATTIGAGAWSDEALAVMRACWRDARTAHHGEFFSFDEIGVLPQAHPRRHPDPDRRPHRARAPPRGPARRRLARRVHHPGRARGRPGPAQGGVRPSAPALRSGHGQRPRRPVAPRHAPRRRPQAPPGLARADHRRISTPIATSASSPCCSRLATATWPTS